MASSCKLELYKFSNLLRIQNRAKCGQGTELQGGGHRTYILDEWNEWGGDTAQSLAVGRGWGCGPNQEII